MLSQRVGSASAVRSHEELFAYWASRREPGRLPGRRQIDPADFKRHLPTVSLIDVLASPALASPALASPALASPALASPALTSPALTSPALASPALASPALASPALASPWEGPVRDYRLRLAGTGLYEVYRGEITGKRLCEVYDEPAADYWRAELDKVVTERRPGVGSHSLAWRGAPHLSILWLRLPLASDGRRVDMILGYDVVVGSHREFTRSGIRAA